MTADPHIRAAFYLSPTLDALWRWSIDGETLVWADDRTIAFEPNLGPRVLLDPAGGRATTPPWMTESVESWQRLAP